MGCDIWEELVECNKKHLVEELAHGLRQPAGAREDLVASVDVLELGISRLDAEVRCADERTAGDAMEGAHADDATAREVAEDG